MPTLQHLSPTKLVPTRSSKGSLRLSFLEKIERIEINSTNEHGSVVYYVLDLERRFNDFANLRYEVWMHAQHKHTDSYTCMYCNAFMKYIELSMSQPRLLVKLSTGVDTRKVLMARFCNAFVSMAIGNQRDARPRDIEYEGSQCIPRAMARFFQRGEA
ncbi:hypothetical protein PHYBOEH_009108 [Phytophthora boehmeriae]|uniref:Uncharacterized protein n=1 Tax=Phytophthora boehmeriae TaxID=109152 RepID=A0A8T1VVC8_9STRA|nr:hypothetical protein PHYBOEH_009108 [Phytophthora boehmeriae]